MNCTSLSDAAFEAELKRLRSASPLVHCMTNQVVQEITANVLLAAGASPAMIVDKAETPAFARIASALLVNVGTLTATQFEAMQLAVDSANAAGVPWVLDPVAAGLLPWRDDCIRQLIAKKPAVIRGNASEILAVAGQGAGGKGVDSTDSSASAVETAAALARCTGAVVCVTGETDYVTDGEHTVEVTGGNVMATLVVGTGCSLSALVAAFIAKAPDRVTATAAACALAKRAAAEAAAVAKGPGRFHDAYLDALYTIDR